MNYLNGAFRILMWVLVVVVLLATLLPLLPFEEWYFRLWDYPRIQILFLAVVAAVCFFVVQYRRRKRGFLLLLLLVGVVVFHAVKAYPYTPLAPRQVDESEHDPQDTTTISLLIANVLQPNKQYHRLLQLVDVYKPDVLLTLESDSNWEQGLKSLEKEYPYTVKVPQSNTYGMHLYSRLPLSREKVMYLMEKEVPSIQALVQLPSGAWVNLLAVHPKPPVPGQSNDSRKRDAELVLIGKKAKSMKGGVMVAGDFNDVAWSETTKLFQEVSGLLDPRIGRGFYNTFHAQYPIFRWPLDHVFHSNHFKLLQMKRLEDIGSDHFPMYLQLSFEPAEKYEQPQVQPEEGTEQEAQETIEEGKNDAKTP